MWLGSFVSLGKNTLKPTIQGASEMKDIESFLLGYKPALLTNPHYPLYPTADLLKLTAYPSVEVRIHQINQLLYFQTEQKKEAFLQQSYRLLPDSPSYHGEVGLALGFPQKAVEYYVTTMKHGATTEAKGYVEYCGIGFVTSIDNMFEDIEWLWRRVPTGSERFDTNVCYKVQGKAKLTLLKIAYLDLAGLSSATLAIKTMLGATSLHM